MSTVTPEDLRVWSGLARDSIDVRQITMQNFSERMRPLGFCVMLESWTTCRQTGRNPAQGGRVRPSERDLRRCGVGADPA